MIQLDEGLREKIGDDAVVDQCLKSIGAMMDGDGTLDYLRLAAMLGEFDTKSRDWMLSCAPEILSAINNKPERSEAIRQILDMGRGKWCVAVSALRKFGDVSNTNSGFRIEWLTHGCDLAKIDQDAADEYFKASPAVLEQLGGQKFDLWARLGKEVAEKSWKAAKEYFKSSPEAIGKIEPGDIEQWVRMGIYIIEKSPKVKTSYNAQSMLAQGAGAGKAKKLDLGIQYFQSAPQILGRLSIHDLQEWVEQGLEVTDEQKEKGNAFFSLQTGGSRKAVDGLVKGLELNDVHTILRPYAEALIGNKVPIKSSSLFYKNLPGLARFFSVSDGINIFLPSQITVFDDEELNFQVYKLALTHELAHMQYGTFKLSLKDIGRLSGFCDPALAFKIFEFLEDERVDYLMGEEYPGLARDRRNIIENYMERWAGKSQELSVFEALNFNLDAEGDGRSDADLCLMSLLKKAIEEVTKPGESAADALTHACRLIKEFETSGQAGSDKGRHFLDRPFFRGVIDLELVTSAKEGVKRLVEEAVNRLKDKISGINTELVERAIERIDEASGVEPEEILWRIEGLDERSDLIDSIRLAIEEMESEKNIRRTVHYDEWNDSIDDYNKAWCRVREMDMPPTSRAIYDDTIKENYGVVSQLRRHFGLLRPDRIQRFFREERGDDIDYSAAIESVIERYAGITPSDRVYIRREKNLRDVSVAFLADMSYSTSDELASGKRIIDVEREGLILMAEALESIGDQWAVYGFSTNRKDKVDFFVLRDFNMPYNDDVKMRFDGMKPMAQTRLGAVIRHASRLLQRQTSRIRILILLSDGRPYDIDYGDSKHALEDTRRALWEGRKKGLTFFCITVDKKSRSYLPYMYGKSNFVVINNIEALPLMLPLIYKRLTS